MPIRVILVEPEKPGNIGAIARSMKNFAVSDLWIVNARTPMTMEARAFAMHGFDVLKSAKKVKTLRQALRNLDIVVGTSSVVTTRLSNISRIPITPRELAQRTQRFQGKIGLVFGRESAGLSNMEVEGCDFMVTIPASRAYGVLNIASAASIIFYELFQARNAQLGPPLATEVVKSRMQLEFGRLVKKSGVQEHKRRLANRAFRNIISRSFITRREASLLLGVLRRTSTKLI